MTTNQIDFLVNGTLFSIMSFLIGRLTERVIYYHKTGEHLQYVKRKNPQIN